MRTILSVLTPAGDQELTWDPRNSEEVLKARAAVSAMKALGYSFFLADGTTPADEVAAGQGALKVRRVSAEELLTAEPEEPSVEEVAVEVEPAPQELPARKGRKGPYRGRRAVAVPPMAGG